MGAIENAKAYGLTLRESADDGSDFTNPDADYRRLFLGEDGQLHVKDSAGTVSGIGGAIADILDLATAEMDDTLVLAPDGAGGVEFRAEAGGGLDTGTTFPVSPTTGDRYRRSDLSYQVFFYDGTRWLSETLYIGHWNTDLADAGLSATGTAIRAPGPLGGLPWFAYKVDVATRVLTTNDGSKYWGVKVTQNDGATATDWGTTFTTASDTASQWITHSISHNAVVDATVEHFALYCTKTSTPGNLNLAASIHYRLIAT